MSIFKYFTEIKLVHSEGEGLIARVQRWLPGVEMTEVETCMATYFWFVLLRIINSRLLTGSTNLIWTVMTVVEDASGKGHA